MRFLSKPLSLRHRLLALVIPVLALSWVIAAYLAYSDTHHEVDELFDADLVQEAKLLADQTPPQISDHRHDRDKDDRHHRRRHNHEDDHDDDGDDKPRRHAHLSHKYEQQIAFQIHDLSGHLLARSSPDIPNLPILGDRLGFADTTINGNQWRAFALSDSHKGILVTVAQRHRIRAELAKRIGAHVIWPMVVLLPLAGVIISLGVRQGLLPLHRLAAEVTSRSVENLKPLDVKYAPNEALPLVESLNSLLSRLCRAFENERRFTSDASHELRTPLAGLKAQLQIAQESTQEDDRRNAIKQSLVAVDRIISLTTQLLELARLDQLQSAPLTNVDLRSIVATAVADCANMAAVKDIDLSLAEGTSEARVEPVLAGVMIRNLVDNAIRYTPRGGKVRASIHTSPSSAIISVEDTGPGLGPSEAERIYERFYRGAAQTESGSGLGLSIVKRIAELHGATIATKPAPGKSGLLVQIHLPLANFK
jgi:two-component system sensor histidine kinase QseC